VLLPELELMPQDAAWSKFATRLERTMRIRVRSRNSHNLRSRVEEFRDLFWSGGLHPLTLRNSSGQAPELPDSEFVRMGRRKPATQPRNIWIPGCLPQEVSRTQGVALLPSFTLVLRSAESDEAKFVLRFVFNASRKGQRKNTMPNPPSTRQRSPDAKLLSESSARRRRAWPAGPPTPSAMSSVMILGSGAEIAFEWCVTYATCCMVCEWHASA